MIRWRDDAVEPGMLSECGTFEIYWHGSMCVWFVRVVRGYGRAEIGCRETVEEAQALARSWLADAIERAMLEELR